MEIKETKNTTSKFNFNQKLFEAIYVGLGLTKLGLSLSSRSSKNYLKYDIAAEFTNNTLPFIRNILFGLFLNLLTAPIKDVNTLYLYLGALATVQLLNNILTNYFNIISSYNRRFTDNILFELILEKYQQISIKSRNQPYFQELERNLNINNLTGFIDAFVRLIAQFYSLMLSFFAITFIDFRLFFIAIFFGIVSLYFRAKSELRRNDFRDENRFNATVLNQTKENFFYENINSMSDNLVINDNYKFLDEKYKHQLKGNYDYQREYYKKVESYRDYSSYLLGISGTITLVLVYLKGIDGILAVGTLSILVTSYTNFTNSLSSIGTIITRLMSDYLQLKSLKEILEYSEVREDVENRKASKNFEIEFKNVSFKYPETEEYVLKNINLKFQKGDKIGIIGQNGAGKSTLVKLLFKLYSPTEGEITLNGQNIYQIKDEEYFKIIKILSQNQRIEDGMNVTDIIRLGDSNKKFNMKDIKLAAKMSGANEFIKNYKDLYNQLIGWRINILNKFSEKKYVTPSQGQERRLQISKIFYADKPITILDEPTSNVDPLTSKEVFENLGKMKKNEILIVIAHDVLRLNNIANKILVMEKGEIAEFGTREELLKKPNSIYNQTLTTYNSKEISIEKE